MMNNFDLVRNWISKHFECSRLYLTIRVVNLEIMYIIEENFRIHTSTVPILYIFLYIRNKFIEVCEISKW